MPIILSDLARAFDALGWRYQTLPERDLLLTSFRTETGSADLVLRPTAGGQAVLLEAVGLGSQPREQAEALLALAWRWPGVAIVRDPEDGEVRLRLILPLGEAPLAADPLRAAVAILLTALDALREALAGGAGEPGGEGAEEQGGGGAGEQGSKGAEERGGGGAGELEDDAEAVPAAVRRAQSLLEALSQAPDQAAFLREHLDEFDDEALAALTAMARAAQEANQGEFAQGLAAVVAAVLALRAERDPEARAWQERLQRLLEARDEGELAGVVDQWPEALGPEVQRLLEGLAEAARRAGEEELAGRIEAVQARLQALRVARPLDAALADFLATETWGEAEALARATPALQGPEALERLAALAQAAEARGEEPAGRRYREHRRRLARWLHQPSIPPTSGWPSLARTYLARRQEADLARAIEAAQGQPEIAALLEAFRRSDLEAVGRLAGELATTLEEQGREEEAWTVALLATDLWARLTEWFNRFPLPQQRQALETGLKACDQAIELCRRLADEPCLAFYLGGKGNGLYRARRLEEAEGAYREAEGIYRRLAGAQPQVYEPDLATTLNNLGNVLRDLRRLEEAEGAYREAEGIYRRLAQAQPQVYEPDLATTLNNLGAVLRDLRRLEEAEGAYREALAIRRRLARPSPRSTSPTWPRPSTTWGPGPAPGLRACCVTCGGWRRRRGPTGRRRGSTVGWLRPSPRSTSPTWPRPSTTWGPCCAICGGWRRRRGPTGRRSLWTPSI
jgi:hypothetical protein